MGCVKTTLTFSGTDSNIESRFPGLPVTAGFTFTCFCPKSNEILFYFAEILQKL